MKVSELKRHLLLSPDATVRFRLPDETDVPVHAHVTEVARIDKRFVDCGGTLRTISRCQLQTWVADDVHHRLTAGKLLGILNKAASLLASEELDVDIEHEKGTISQYPLASIQARGGEIFFLLEPRHTACLAEDKCLPPPPNNSIFFKPLARL
jgi:hypothetical protein